MSPNHVPTHVSIDRRPTGAACPAGKSRLMPTSMRSSLVLLALAVSAACSGPEGTTGTLVTIKSFTATPTHVAAGGSTKLEWVIEGGVTKVDVFRAGELVTTSAAATGSVDVSDLPTGSTTFRLVATGDLNSPQASTSVVAVSAPTIVSFVTDTTAVAPGGAATLQWKTLLGDRVELRRGSDVVETFEGRDGATVVRPPTTSTYTLRVIGVGGQDEEAITITVHDAPTIDTFTASAATVVAGEPVTLTWTTSHAETVSIHGGTGLLFTAPAAQVASGTTSLTLPASNELVLFAQGPGGLVTKSVSVAVRAPARVLSFTGQPRDVLLGTTARLEWTVAGVDGVQLTANGTEVDLDGNDGATGHLDVTPTEETVYELTGRSAFEEVKASITISVHGVPTVESFTADRASVFRRRDPAVLSWVTKNGSAVSITTDRGEAIDVGTASAAAGSVEVSPLSDTAYTLTVAGPGGLVRSAPVTVTVAEPPPLITMSLVRDAIVERTPPESTELSWEILDGASYELFATPLEGTRTPVPLEGRGLADVMTVSPPVTTVYTIVATGPGGTSEEEITLTVARPPRFTKATAKPFITRGTTANPRTYTITWATTDAYNVSILDPFYYIQESPAFTSIATKAGTTQVSMPDPDKGMVDIEFPDDFVYPLWVKSSFSGNHTSARMAVDGYLCFGGDAECTSNGGPMVSQGANQSIPSTLTTPGTSSGRPNNLIAAFWDDLKANANTRFYWRIDGTAPDRRMTFEWAHHDFAATTTDGEDLTFQAVIFESGRWEIRQAPRVAGTKFPGQNVRWGTSASVGIEGPSTGTSTTGSVGFTFGNNSSTAAALCRSGFVAGKTSPVTVGTCNPITLNRPWLAPANNTYTLTSPTATAQATATVKLRAYGPLGVANAEIVVGLTNEVYVHELTASRTHVGAGETVRLQWKVGNSAATSIEDVTKVELKANGTVIHASGKPTAVLSTLDVTPTVDTTYSLYAENAAGDGQTKTITVKVGAPTVTFRTDRATGPVGDTFKLRWTSTGADSLTVKGPDGTPLPATPAFPITQAANAAFVASGSVDVVVSASGTYTLEATNPSGTTTATLPIAITTELQIAAFAADRTVQTEDGPVVLSWETFNTDSIDLYAGAATTPLNTVTYDAPNRRKGTLVATIGATATTYRLVARKGAEVVEQSVSVDVVPKARGTLAASRTNMAWNEQVDLTWTSTNATKIRLYELASTAPNAPEALEVAAGHDVPSGTVRLTLQKSTRYRLVLFNALDSRVEIDLEPAITVTLGTPTMTLNVTPLVAQKGGYVQLSWVGDQIDRTYLWMRSPPTASGSTTLTTNVDPVQLPFDYQPYGFVDISQTGTQLFLATSAAPTVEQLDTGRAIVDFPLDFRPNWLGDDVGRMMVHADGYLMLAAPGAPDSAFDCNTSTCSTTTISTSTTSTARQMIAPFWALLSGCHGFSTSTGCADGRTPGRVHWELRGTAPNRVLIVQWTDWDAQAATEAGSYTFQAMLHEKGDTEVQFKTMEGLASPGFARGSDATVGVDRRSFRGSPINYFVQILNDDPLISPGDGWRIYTGAQAPTGSVRSFMTSLKGTAPAQTVIFRATGFVPGTQTSVNSAKTVDVRAGVHDLVVSELGIAPGGPTGTNDQWIEIANRVAAAVPITGYQLQTSSGTYPLTGTIPSSGFLLVAEQGATTPAGATVIRVTPPAGKRLLDKGADVVILRADDVLIDRVEYDASAGWRVPSTGSLSFDQGAAASTAADARPAYRNDPPLTWCTVAPTPNATNGKCWSFVVSTFDPTTRLVDASNNALPGTFQPLDASVATTTHNRAGVAELGFSFPYFGERYTKITVNDEGSAGFGDFYGSTTTNTVTLPSTSTTTGFRDGIYPFWDGMQRDIAGGGRILTRTTGEPGARVFVAYWDRYTFSSPAGGLASFALVLKETGEIEFHYDRLEQTGTGNVHLGAAATFGLEAFGDTYGVLYAGATSTTGPALLPSPFSQFSLKLTRQQ